MSGYVVAGLPLGLLALLFVIAPGFLEPMFDAEVNFLGIPAGVSLMGLGLLMMFIGFMIIRRIVDIEV
jgi:Flp pilus assembly protein TadB